ncbi:RNA-binding S4 domain-containing protein [Clostridium fallax]|uniref:Ribosome-associated protein n=1 Tax=Clostridium fallax TaxID=1533 RepID=A0A1M4X480_9CLOT|nr:RNA-binding S4 domain-containing protein [Clostridium fallax]SHE87992.1 ribosome-associated protein [Clostridium fallax]SQB22523.1 S4 domain-containing protein YaaA [Clostridium fallax]
MKEININTEFIKLDQFLKWSGIVSLGSEAKILVAEGLVKVNGEICTQRGKKLFVGDKVQFEEQEYSII